MTNGLLIFLYMILFLKFASNSAKNYIENNCPILSLPKNNKRLKMSRLKQGDRGSLPFTPMICKIVDNDNKVWDTYSLLPIIITVSQLAVTVKQRRMSNWNTTEKENDHKAGKKTKIWFNQTKTSIKICKVNSFQHNLAGCVMSLAISTVGTENKSTEGNLHDKRWGKTNRAPERKQNRIKTDYQ